MIPATAEKIEKEDLPRLSFPKEPVHLSDEHRRELDAKLDRARKLGNTDHNKCRILFKDSTGLKYVETTVWSFDDRNILVKYGHSIPLPRVLDVQMF
jgi:hypothetical protein